MKSQFLVIFFCAFLLVQCYGLAREESKESPIPERPKISDGKYYEECDKYQPDKLEECERKTHLCPTPPYDRLMYRYCKASCKMGPCEV